MIFIFRKVKVDIACSLSSYVPGTFLAVNDKENASFTMFFIPSLNGIVSFVVRSCYEIVLPILKLEWTMVLHRLSWLQGMICQISCVTSSKPA